MRKELKDMAILIGMPEEELEQIEKNLSKEDFEKYLIEKRNDVIGKKDYIGSIEKLIQIRGLEEFFRDKTKEELEAIDKVILIHERKKELSLFLSITLKEVDRLIQNPEELEERIDAQETENLIQSLIDQGATREEALSIIDNPEEHPKTLIVTEEDVQAYEKSSHFVSYQLQELYNKSISPERLDQVRSDTIKQLTEDVFSRKELREKIEKELTKEGINKLKKQIIEKIEKSFYFIVNLPPERLSERVLVGWNILEIRIEEDIFKEYASLDNLQSIFEKYKLTFKEIDKERFIIGKSLYENISTVETSTPLRTSGEIKVFESLMSLLHKNSSLDKKSDSYFLGNDTQGITKNISLNKKGRVTPRLLINPIDLYKEYTGKINPSGRVRAQIYKIVKNLSNRMIDIKFEEGSKSITYNTPLFVWARLKDSDKEEWAFVFDHIVVQGIKERFIPTTGRIKEMELLVGARSVTPAMWLLCKQFEDCLSRKNKILVYNIKEEGLEELLQIKGDKKYIREKKIKNSIEVNKDLGILNKVEIKKGVKGDKIYFFHINGDFR